MTKRLFGPPPHSENPYAKLTSPRGIPVDQLVSVLQKKSAAADHSYRDELIEIHRVAENNGTADGIYRRIPD